MQLSCVVREKRSSFFVKGYCYYSVCNYRTTTLCKFC
uniref:Uncharacterized protein n=1 Tax=Arundo donax TaxID=35708 RepID=A0A0A9A2C8_ARUDO